MTVETGGATTVAPQDSELIQLLTPEGERIEHPEYPFPDDADLKGMYRDMVLVRRIDTEAIALQRQGELGLWASLLGQEAAQVGSGRALSPNDMAFPSYREHGVAWCRGLDPVRLRHRKRRRRSALGALQQMAAGLPRGRTSSVPREPV